MPPRRAKTGLGLVPWLALAILLHQSILGIVLLVNHLAPSRVEPQPMEVSLVDESELPAGARGLLEPEDGLAVAPPETPLESKSEEQKKAEAEAKREEKDTNPHGQVVEIPQPVEEKVPRKSDYVSEYNSSVEKQTVHRGRPGESEGAAPRAGEKLSRAQPRPPEAPSPPAPPPGPPGPPATPKLAMRPLPERAAAPGPRRPEGAPPDDQVAPDGIRPAVPPRTGAPPTGGAPSPSPGGGGAGGARRLTVADLTPSEEMLSRAIGRGGSVDALQDVEEGEYTALNSRRWKFASFFNRVKRSVAQNWHPDRAYRRRDPQGNVYGFKDRLTVLRVQLTADGALKDVFVEQPSGVDFLDDEAIRAFRAAQPFPNPPRQLVGESGLISFRFGFLFELSHAPMFRVFRYRD